MDWTGSRQRAETSGPIPASNNNGVRAGIKDVLHASGLPLPILRLSAAHRLAARSPVPCLSESHSGAAPAGFSSSAPTAAATAAPAAPAAAPVVHSASARSSVDAPIVQNEEHVRIGGSRSGRCLWRVDSSHRHQHVQRTAQSEPPAGAAVQRAQLRLPPPRFRLGCGRLSSGQRSGPLHEPADTQSLLLSRMGSQRPVRLFRRAQDPIRFSVRRIRRRGRQHRRGTSRSMDQTGNYGFSAQQRKLTPLRCPLIRSGGIKPSR